MQRVGSFPGVSSVRAAWPGDVRTDLLSGLVVAIALIPEAISFSIIAGVDPKVGLYASFTIAIVISLVGGRPGMISAATGAVALLVVPLVRDHGVEYLFAAGLLAGGLQILFGVLKVGHLMRFVPRPVMVGFVNALAILIFLAQVPHVRGGSWAVYAVAAAGLALIYLVPRVTRAVPAPLVAIVVLTAAAVLLHVARADGEGHGRAPVRAARLRAPRGSADPAHARDRRALLALDRDRRPDRVAADGEADRRHHGHAVRQGSRVPRPGRRERRERPARRSAGLRDDRPVDDQHAVGRAQPALDARVRGLPAPAARRLRRRRRGGSPSRRSSR